MADIHIRKVDDQRYKELKLQAVSEGVSLKQLVKRLLGFEAPPKDFIEVHRIELSPAGHEMHVTDVVPRHDPRTCRIHRCGMCLAAKEKSRP